MAFPAADVWYSRLGMKFGSYRQILLDTFQEKSKNRALYSMAAFARDLGLPHSRLIEVLKGRQGLSKASALAICERIGFSSKVSERFCLLVAAEHARSKKERELATARLLESGENDRIHFVTPEQTGQMKWTHLAILCLFEIAGLRVTPSLINERLGLEPPEALRALRTLQSAGFLGENDTGWFLLTKRIESLTFSGPTPEATRAIHVDMMTKARQAMMTAAIEGRQIGTSIFALRRNDLLEYKNMIRDFRRRIEERANELGEKDAVYCLGMQFFEVTK